MTQYIPKSALVAEIERLYKKWEMSNYIYWKLISFIDTLEVKEVDLEKEIELVKGDYEQVDVAWNNDFDYIAKHFFEFGMSVGIKAQKGEEYGM